MIIETMDWDSKFFNFLVGRICLHDPKQITELYEFTHNTAFKVIYIFLDCPTDKKIAEIKKIAPLYDKKVCYNKNVSNDAGIPEKICLYRGKLTKDLLSLALISGQYSRFKIDPLFKPWFEKLYTIWIEKSLSGEMADAVYVATLGKSMAGFITVKKKYEDGQIGLVAVHPDFRGQGIGSSLLKAADFWFLTNGIKNASVITQRDNLPACRLYEKNGYSVCTETAIFHLWKNR